jgi:hypothetical protein
VAPKSGRFFLPPTRHYSLLRQLLVFLSRSFTIAPLFISLLNRVTHALHHYVQEPTINRWSGRLDCIMTFDAAGGNDGIDSLREYWPAAMVDTCSYRK